MGQDQQNQARIGIWEKKEKKVVFFKALIWEGSHPALCVNHMRCFRDVLPKDLQRLL